MTDKEQKKAAKEFKERWSGTGYEKGEGQKFWIDLLTTVYDVKPNEIKDFIDFENQVLLDHMSFIDGYIPSTAVMIEQKSIGKDLRKGIKQSDGSVLTPFQQAKRYVTELPRSMHPKWIISCNFEEFLIYDMEKPHGEPEQIFLKDLDRDYYSLKFLVDRTQDKYKQEKEISLDAGKLVGKLYDAILPQYKDPEAPESLHSLNVLCVRLVFCMYAEDAGIFGKWQFHDYLEQFKPKEMHRKLGELFRVLDMDEEKRQEYDKYMDEDLSAFPYVNGGLFSDDVEIPRFNDEIADILLNEACPFDWYRISPTIFGAAFESTLNPDTRRTGGMHYTSLENIDKVIKPLFLDQLENELEGIFALKTPNIRDRQLSAFQKKLSELTFLDPACGSGNFLTATYIALRKMENRILRYMHVQGQQIMDGVNPIMVKINQFYGIEINDFGVSVARTALWIAQSQAHNETEEIIEKKIDFLPLEYYPNIVKGNALEIDWNSLFTEQKLSYILGIIWTNKYMSALGTQHHFIPLIA